MSDRVTLYSRETGRRYTRLPDCAADMLASGQFTLEPAIVAPSEHTADASLDASPSIGSAPVAPSPDTPKRRRKAA